MSKHTEVLNDMASLLLQSGNLNVSQITHPCFWRLAKANQLIFSVGRAVVEQFGEDRIPVEFLPTYKHQEQLYDNTVILMAELLAEFEKLNLPFLTIKSFLPFPFVDSNIDIVVIHTGQSSKYVQKLLELEFEHMFNLADLREPRKKMYIRSSWRLKNKVFPKVHVHRAISWNGIDYLDLPHVAARSQKWCQGDVKIPIPCPEDELLIMAAHAFFENKFITLHELYYLTYLTPQITNWEVLVAEAAKFHWDDAFCQFVSLAAALASAVGLTLSIPASFQPAQNLDVRLPYMLPVRQTFAYSWRKLIRDLAAGHWRQLTRQLFTYSFVDAVWMYRKAWRKQRKVQIC